MKIAEKLGLEDEIFCRMILTTKMLFSNVMGHVAELHYEKFLKKADIDFNKAKTDVPFDYIVNGEKNQVKRWKTASTNTKSIAVDLTKTHGKRKNNADKFYKKTDFDNLVMFDVGFTRYKTINCKDISQNKKYPDRLPRSFRTIRTDDNDKLSKFELEFLKTIKQTNTFYPRAIKSFRKEKKLTYLQLLEKCCNLTIKEIDSVFSADNFRLITGAKGFAAEEHFNCFLDEQKIPKKQEEAMYSKIDHWVYGNIGVQVKILNKGGDRKDYWTVSTHKSHGTGEDALFSDDRFDVLALFIGYKIDEEVCKYTPVSVSREFIFVPINELEQHHKYPGYLKRTSKISKDKYKINDISNIKKK